jgi:hypothetical protein
MLTRIFYLAYFSSLSLFSDVLFLKTGEAIEGLYLNGDSRGVQFETDTGKILVQRKDVLKLELGYTGSSFCFKRKGKEAECEGILHSVSEESFSYVKGKAGTKVETNSMDSIVYLKLYKTRKSDRFLGIFAIGLEVTINTDGKKELGKIEEYNFPERRILIKSNGLKKYIDEDSIQFIEWKKKPGFLQYTKFALEYSLPGIHQYNSNKLTGITLGTLFLLFSAAIPIEYVAAQKSAAKNFDYIPVGDNIYIVSGLDSDSTFEKHKNQYYYAIGGLGAIYMIHSYTIFKEFREGKIPGFNSLEVSVTKTSPETRVFKNPEQTGMNTNIELKYSYSF